MNLQYVDVLYAGCIVVSSIQSICWMLIQWWEDANKQAEQTWEATDRKYSLPTCEQGPHDTDGQPGDAEGFG